MKINEIISGTLELRAFVLGSIANFELNDPIDERKELDVSVSVKENRYYIKFSYFAAIESDNNSDLSMMKDSKYYDEEIEFSILDTQSVNKLAKEIWECVNIINDFKFKEI